MTNVDLQLAEAPADPITRVDIRGLQTSCWVVLIVIAIVRAWLTRYFIHGDAISYLDLGRMIAEGHSGSAIHAYWSPGYPILLSLFLRVFHPDAYWESPLAHFVNVVVFIGALACFQLFWRELRQWHENYAKRCGTEISERAFWILGYSAYAIAALNVIGVALVCPDLLVAALCCLAGWAALRFRRSPSTGRALVLGLVLALGYYAKSPFFPMGFVFIVCAGLGWPPPRRTILLGGTALATYLLMCAPYIAAISLSKGHFTFGESARLAQAFYINGVQYYQHWQGGPPGSGIPVHPTRKLNDFPAIYEFAAMDMGTYPPWFDPTYWYQGVTPHPNWKLQTKIFVANLLLEFQIIMEFCAMLVAAVIVLALLTGSRRRWMKGFWDLWYIWAPAAIALPMFALVHVESRFLGGWLILLFAGAICACPQPAGGSTGRVVSCVAFAAVLTATASLASQASQEVLGRDHTTDRNPSSAVIATFLLNNGLHPGEQVAVIGDGADGAYWAHLARLRVVSEIPAGYWPPEAHPSLDFWESGPERQQRSLRILEQTGAKAVVAGSQTSMPGMVPSVVPSSWKKIDGTWAYVYFFHANP